MEGRKNTRLLNWFGIRKVFYTNCHDEIKLPCVVFYTDDVMAEPTYKMVIFITALFSNEEKNNNKRIKKLANLSNKMETRHERLRVEK